MLRTKVNRVEVTSSYEENSQRPSLYFIARLVYSATVNFILEKRIGNSFAKVVKILLNPLRLYNIVSDLTEHNTIILTIRRPELLYKWQRIYLARSFRMKQRIAILTYHYKYVARRFNPKFYPQLLDGKIILWQSIVEGQSAAICLCFPEYDREGDLSLILEHDATPVYELSFTILPGMLAGLVAPEVMFVARIQGRKGLFDSIKAATKLCHGISPPYLLMAAAEGIARSLNIQFICGVSANDKLSRDCSSKYDEFWATFFAVKTKDNFYAIPVPVPHRPLEQCDPAHRRRTLRKREFKAEIVESVRMTFSDSIAVVPKICGESQG